MAFGVETIRNPYDLASLPPSMSTPPRIFDWAFFPRRNRSRAVAMSIFAAGVASCMNAHALEANEVFRKVKAGIVVIRAFDAKQEMRAAASGVLVDTTQVVTNCHAIRQSTRLEVSQGAIVRSARLHFQDLDRNLCQISLDSPFPDATPLGVMIPSTALEIGQAAYAVGSPFGQDLTIVRGMIAGTKDKPGDAAKLIRTDVAVTPGSTGGGLFDREARLIGIITSGLIDSQNLNLALPTEWVAELAKRNADLISDNVNIEVAEPRAALPPAPTEPSLVKFKSGARWRYRFSTGGRDLGSVIIQVVSVTGDRVREKVTREGYPSYVSDRTLTVAAKPVSFAPLVVLPGGYQFPELAPYFPAEISLRTGESWLDLPGEYYIPMVGRRVLATRVRIAGKERVLVPAGQFEAWRIETEHEYVGNPAGAIMKTKCIYWYSSQAARSVKIIVEGLSPMPGHRSKELYELLQYEGPM